RASRRPYCAPAWMLAWWRHAAPRRAALRVILVRRGDELLGVAPFFVDRGYGGLARYRFLAAGTSMRVEPLACPGAEGAVAGAWAVGGGGARRRGAVGPPGRRAAGTDPAAGGADVRTVDGVSEPELPKPDAPRSSTARGPRSDVPDRGSRRRGIGSRGRSILR